VILLGLFLLLARLCAPSAQGQWPPLAEADWAAWHYQTLDETAQGDYLIVGEVRAAGKRAGRVAFDIIDEGNYYALEFLQYSVRLLRVESGLELPMDGGSPTRPNGRKWIELVIRCEGGRIEVFLDGVLAAAAADSTFPGGKIATGSLDGSVEFRDLRVQDTEPAYLDDDFMRAEGEAGGWEVVKGDWRVQSVGSPVRSTNAFNFTVDNAPKGATALVGDWFWHDYQVAVSCESHGPGQAGLYAYYRDARNHLLFTCGQANPKAGSVAELFAVARGQRRSLAKAPLAFVPGQWYRLALKMDGPHVTGVVDGHPVLTAQTERGLGGQVGLCAATTEGVTFDDFSVRPSNAIDSGTERLALWQAVGGDWNAGRNGEIQGFAIGASASEAKLLARQSVHGDVRLSSQAKPPTGGTVGLVAGWEDEGNHHALVCGGEPPTARLVTVSDGKTTIQAEAPVQAADQPLPMELALMGQAIRARVGDGVTLTASNGLLPRGRVGLLLANGQADFAPPSVERLSPLPEVPRFEGAFSEEVSMADWAAENADWTTIPQGDGQAVPSCWHKAPAYGDQQLTLRLTGPPAAPVSLYEASPEIGARTEGYAFTVTPGSGGTATLLRAGQPTATQPLNLDVLQEVSLAKRGPLLIGSANGQPALFFLDPEPLRGAFAGWTAPAGTATPSDTTFRADSVLSYTFREAPSDWWIGSGDWRITNRWDCEPRWTFFIGGSEQVACLWNKHEFGSDLTLDFYGAIRFDSTQGYEYRYASDINCTIAADGQDLTSGYSLMFGGWDNKFTRLLRGREAVAESTTALIPRSSSIHRQWFNLRVCKSGARIRCWLDGQPLFDYTDPNPLPGRRVALWTYHNAIAIARVRIASTQVAPGPLTPPDRAPATPYDVPSQ
jgi:hypothetical protein